MSLTSVLSYSNKEFKDFRIFLGESFPAPKFSSDQSIKAEPMTTNHALIGTAFDYLLRFNLKKKYKTKVYSNQWASESALRYFKDRYSDTIYDSDYSLDNLDGEELIKLSEERRRKNKVQNRQVSIKFKNCKKIYGQFLNSKL